MASGPSPLKYKRPARLVTMASTPANSSVGFMSMLQIMSSLAHTPMR
jgi:hypothetical protein